MPNNATLQEQITRFQDATRKASVWAETHAVSAGAGSPLVLKQNLHEIGKSCQKYLKALATRPAVGIFGESQTGKSFLISVLAATKGNTSVKIIDHFSGRQHDFVNDINPKGGEVESTGIITRFTVVPVAASKDTPYLVKPFTQAELVKIVVNGYFLDFESESPRSYQFNPEEIYATLTRLKPAKSSYVHPEFTEEDIVDIKAYLEKIALKSISPFNTSSYWDDALSLLPYLNYNERWEFLQYLWGKNQFFTDVFNTLSEGLSKTDFSRTLQIGVEALLPREISIIDITRCNQIFNKPDQSEDLLNIVCENGKRTQMPRAVLGALTAELVVNIPKEVAEQTDMDFLNEADILDFPGCRSRQLNKDQEFNNFPVSGKLEVFRRGKVAFLFEKYTDDFSINALIITIPQRSMEVKKLSVHVYDWIKVYVGDSPEKRLDRLTACKNLPQINQASVNDMVPLMMALTMFDKDLLDKPNMKNNDPDRWKGRFYQNYYQFFGMEKTFENYLESWLPGRESFMNTFPLRNPLFADSAVIFKREKREEGIVELSLTDEYVQVLPQVAEAFGINEYVKKLVRNTNQVFQSVAAPMRYGADELRRSINTVCRAAIKEHLILSHFEETKDRFMSLFNQFNWNSDAEQALLKARTNAARAYGAVTMMQTKQNTFGSALHYFNLREEVSFGVYFKMVNDSLIQDRQPAATNGVAEKSQRTSLSDYVQLLGIPVTGQEDRDAYLSLLKEFYGLEDDDAIIGLLEQDNVDWKLIDKKRMKDKADQFSEQLLTRWATAIQELRTPDFCNRMGIKSDIVDLIIEQLNKSMLRVDLEHFISDSVREEILSYHPVNNPNFDIVARISSSIVNRFVNSFGWYFVPNAERPLNLEKAIIFDETNQRIPDKKALMTDIPDDRLPIYDDWRIGLKQSFERNLTGNFESADKLLAIRKLKEILTPMVNSNQ